MLHMWGVCLYWKLFYCIGPLNKCLDEVDCCGNNIEHSSNLWKLMKLVNVTIAYQTSFDRLVHHN